MRLSTLNFDALYEINKLTPLNPLDSSEYLHKPTQTFQIVGREPSSDDILITDQIFTSERSDIRRVFTGSKFLSLTEDLLSTHLKQCIHKV